MFLCKNPSKSKHIKRKTIINTTWTYLNAYTQEEA